MKKEWLTIGAEVTVFFEYANSVDGEIIDISQEEGCQAEYLIKSKDGTINQIMNYSHMKGYNKKETTEKTK